jgi:toxin ParE1/3/4
MAYSIIVSPRAQKEIENAIDYYALYSIDAPKKFVMLLQNTYESLKLNPFFRVRYKDVRALKIKKRPYLLYFVINETKMTVRVLSCFHDRRNPKQRPKYKS